MLQVAPNLTDPDGSCLTEARVLIQHRDPSNTEAFKRTLRLAVVEPLKLPARSPNLNAFAEWFVRPVKSY